MKYFYCSVSGASVWGTWGSFQKALRNVYKLRNGTFSIEIPNIKNAEVERMIKVGFSGQRYWRWRNKKWDTATWTEPTETDLERWLERKEAK